jgi:hypothetical protein
MDSLKHEAIVKYHSIRNIIPIKLRSFEEAIKAAKEEQIRRNARSLKKSLPPII